MQFHLMTWLPLDWYDCYLQVSQGITGRCAHITGARQTCTPCCPLLYFIKGGSAGKRLQEALSHYGGTPGDTCGRASGVLVFGGSLHSELGQNCRDLNTFPPGKKKTTKSKGNPPPVTKGDFKESSLPFPGLCVLHWALHRAFIPPGKRSGVCG